MTPPSQARRRHARANAERERTNAKHADAATRARAPTPTPSARQRQACLHTRASPSLPPLGGDGGGSGRWRAGRRRRQRRRRRRWARAAAARASRPGVGDETDMTYVQLRGQLDWRTQAARAWARLPRRRVLEIQWRSRGLGNDSTDVCLCRAIGGPSATRRQRATPLCSRDPRIRPSDGEETVGETAVRATPRVVSADILCLNATPPSRRPKCGCAGSPQGMSNFEVSSTMVAPDAWMRLAVVFDFSRRRLVAPRFHVFFPPYFVT